MSTFLLNADITVKAPHCFYFTSLKQNIEITLLSPISLFTLLAEITLNVFGKTLRPSQSTQANFRVW